MLYILVGDIISISSGVGRRMGYVRQKTDKCCEIFYFC